MAEVICYIEQDAPHIRYAVGHVLRRMLGWDARIITRPAELPGPDIPLIHYAETPTAHGFHVRPTLRAHPADDGPPDIFSAAWDLLSLPEEHSPTIPRDAHGRVPVAALSVDRNGWLEQPVLDQWALAFAAKAHAALPHLPPVRRRYSHVATMDVDNGFMFLGREWWRTAGSVARDILRGRSGRLGLRRRVLMRKQADPYDIYSFFRELAQANADRSIVNFLVGARGPHDHAVGTAHPLMRQRIAEMAQWADVGVHPSYGSSDRPERIAQERSRLEAVIGRPVRTSRQHFLRMDLPSTFQELVRAGIREDHSIGLSGSIGFKAGTCTPFPYFDPSTQQETELMLWPFAVMDSAMAYQMHLSPDEAIARAKRLVDVVRSVQGTFIGVWHERFLSDHGSERGWRRVAEEIIRYAKA